MNVKRYIKEDGVEKVKKYKIGEVPKDEEVAPGEFVLVERLIAGKLNDIDQIFAGITSGEVLFSHVMDSLSFVCDSTEWDSKVMNTPSPIMTTGLFQINDGRRLSPEFLDEKRA